MSAKQKATIICCDSTHQNCLEPVATDAKRIMFMYWGRRGGMTQFTLEVGRAARNDIQISPTISVSRDNEAFDQFRAQDIALMPVKLFKSNIGAATELWRLPRVCRNLIASLKQHRTQAVISLMPHVWGPFVASAIRRADIEYITIIHDAERHPGDPTGIVQNWMQREIDSSNLVFTLSDHVSEKLVSRGRVQKSKLVTLFPPDLSYGAVATSSVPQPSEPIRLLFLGRIMRYKGLPMLLDSIDLLVAEGWNIELGVFGEGNVSTESARLEKMGAKIVNRWLTEEEIGKIIPQYHAVALSHIEASQSGIVSTAFGSGVPVIATPVGGIVEQVQHHRTGIVAERVDARAIANAIKEIVTPGLYERMCLEIRNTRNDRSMERFVRLCATHIPVNKATS